MKALTAVAGFLSMASCAFAAQQHEAPPTGRYIVRVKSEADSAATASQHGLRQTHSLHGLIHGWAGEVPLNKLSELAQDPNVTAIVPDAAVSTFSNAELNESSANTIVPAGIERIGAAPGTSLFSGAGIGVAILDTGVDLSQRDLNCSSNSYSTYGVIGQDDNGHGTHVAGIIGGLGRDSAVIGVAPTAVLYSVKVLDAKGNGYDSDIIAGLNWIRANATNCVPPIRVVNMSFGRPASPHDRLLHEAIADVVANGITVVVAAGNEPSRQVRDTVPAGFPEVIAVGSTTATEGRSSSEFGNIAADTESFFTTVGAMERSGTGIAVSAPGEEREDIEGDRVYSVGILSTRLGGGLARMSGTSMAAPHVAGTVALLYQKAAMLGFILQPVDAKLAVMNSDRVGIAPLNSRTSTGEFLSLAVDGDREGILNLPGALAFVDSLIGP